MKEYWFRSWLKRYLVGSEYSLKKAIGIPRALDALIEGAPEPKLPARESAPIHAELTGGKGIDLTGELGCRAEKCLREEVDGLFRHTWHYFDRITLPDQALTAVLGFQKNKSKEVLARRLVPAMHAVALIDGVGGRELVAFEPRRPGCSDHAEEHARKANIMQAFSNMSTLSKEVAESAKISWKCEQHGDHAHLNFQLVHPFFQHTEWGEICSKHQAIPKKDSSIKFAVAKDVVDKYMGALSSDALAARNTKTALGAAIPFYKRLLATHPTAEVESVAFDIDFPISKKIPVETLIKLRRDEKPSFERFQAALRNAIAERIKTSTSSDSLRLAEEIRRDVIDPELRRLRDLLDVSKAHATKSGALGIALGAASATVGLLTPLSSNQIGIGLTVGGAVSLGLSSVKKAVDDHLATKKIVSLSDMYFLWKAHQH